MTEEKPKTTRGIVSDVESDAIRHSREVHAWAETHPQWKRQHVGDKPKIRNKCGDCAAWRTNFCMWNTDDGPGVQAQDDACSLFYHRPRIDSSKQFEKTVNSL